jgi:glycosyltransferase involved in cell wall biosynthesis
MKVLWFEVTIPKGYSEHGSHGAGWQDALENIVKKNNDIELGIAFETQNAAHENCKIDGVRYFPLKTKYSAIERIQSKYTWDTGRNQLVPLALKAIDEFKPDVIHVFGSEWCYGQVAEATDIPVVIHMQGSIPAYNNAFYPPGYNEWTEWFFCLTHFRFKNLIALPLAWRKRKSWKIQEERTLKAVDNYMGRTEWDRGMVDLYHPNANYFYCSEALRPSFIGKARDWKPTGNTKIKLITTGCSSFWKGLDTIVRTATILKERKIDFEWNIAGAAANKELIEWKEKIKMEDVGIKFLGMIDSDLLLKHLLDSDMYIHTAYIDNSPNSICEAQYLGLPIVSSYVGGILSLIENDKDGLLVPANDPYTLSNEIIKLFENVDRQIKYSKNSITRARQRHNPKVILNDLLNVYSKLEVSTRN